MFNAIKWAFKLGQQTERHRIAAILNAERQNAPYFEYGTGNDKEARSAAVEATNLAVAAIINRITQPQHIESETFSVLFPKEDK